MRRGRSQLTVEGAERRAEIVRLRTARVEWAEIAARFAISPSRAVRIYQDAIASAPNAAVAEHRVELSRLADLAISSLIEIAQDEDNSPRTRVEAWSVTRAWAERLAKLHGADADRGADVVIEAGVPANLHELVAKRVVELRAEAS